MYADSIESLVRNEIQKTKIEMANEVSCSAGGECVSRSCCFHQAPECMLGRAATSAPRALLTLTHSRPLLPPHHHTAGHRRGPL